MKNMTTDEKIQLKHEELTLVDNPEKRQKILLLIKKLQLKKEIEAIQRKIEQIS